MRWFFDSVGRFGFGQTLVIMWSVIVDMGFDFRYGTETTRRIPKEQIATDSENIIHCVNYGASKSTPFKHLMRRLELPKDAAFVDLGSGKGRALMLASQYGFRRVVGIDFSGELCTKARENMKKFMARCPSASAVEIIESDVTKYNFREMMKRSFSCWTRSTLQS